MRGPRAADTSARIRGRRVERGRVDPTGARRARAADDRPTADAPPDSVRGAAYHFECATAKARSPSAKPTEATTTQPPPCPQPPRGACLRAVGGPAHAEALIVLRAATSERE